MDKVNSGMSDTDENLGDSPPRLVENYLPNDVTRRPVPPGHRRLAIILLVIIVALTGTGLVLAVCGIFGARAAAPVAGEVGEGN